MRLKKQSIRSKASVQSFTLDDLSVARESAETLVEIFEKNIRYINEKGDSSDYRNEFPYNLISGATQSIVTLATIVLAAHDIPLKERSAILDFCVIKLTDIQQSALGYCQKYKSNYKTGNIGRGLAEATDALLKMRLHQRRLEAVLSSKDRPTV